MHRFPRVPVADVAARGRSWDSGIRFRVPQVVRHLRFEDARQAPGPLLQLMLRSFTSITRWSLQQPGKVLRILRLPVSRLILSIVIFALIAAVIALAGTLPALKGLANSVYVPLTASLVALLSVGIFIERRTVSGLGFPLRLAASHIGLGLLIGAVLQALVAGTLFLLGFYQGSLNSSAPELGRVLFIAFAWSILPALWEEVVFRGIIFRLIEEWAGTWIALLVSALFFGVAHLLSPNASWWAAASTAIEAGLLLGLAFVVTRNLWLVVGIHWAWNFFQGRVFGTSVSGTSAKESLLTATITGPEVLTGGRFGPEAGLPAIAFCLIAAALFLMVARRRKLLLPRRRISQEDALTPQPSTTP
jgi:uncharacterized protein